MFLSSKEKSFELRQFLKGGEGAIHMEMFKPVTGLPAHYRMFGEMVIKPGCSIGKHTHTGESEIYYILEGEGILDDNGTERVQRAGDFSVCYDGEFHAIANKTGQDLRVLAVIVTNA